MIFSFSRHWTSAVCVCFLLIAFTIDAGAQQAADTSGKLPIEILPSTGTMLQFITTDSGGINKLIGNVALKQGENFLYCDSAYINTAKNNVESFGNVKIVQPGGTQVESDYLRYTGNIRVAFLQGNVTLTDGKNNLWASELTYNLGTKVGVYTQGGTLQSESTTLSSNVGTYNVRSKDARFTGEVFVTDPEYNVTSEDLGYNTETKVVLFFGPSVVSNDQSVLHTSDGSWDAKNEIAHFRTRSSLQNEAQYIEGDRMDYNRKTGLGVATGNVYALDTNQRTTMYSGYAEYNEITKELLSTVKPVMKKVNNNDSLYIRADTFYAAPVPRKDSLPGKTIVTKSSQKIGKDVIETREITSTDSSSAVPDSTRPRYFIGYHHVLVFSDSMQARCDSIRYSQGDSIMKLMYDPVVWSRSSQLTGDTILLYSDTSSLRKLFIPNNAFIASRSGPEKAKMFDQIQGKTLTGYFENNALREMVVYPNAEAIYYSKDDDGAYLGVQQAQSERMRVFFENKEMSKIVLEQDVKQTMTPLQKANIAALKLSRFQWLADKRPQSIAELFLYDPYGLDKPADERKLKQPETEPNKSGKKKKR
ncbi:MAG TPA: OstA-like protein [Flavipsychrobacter sp.]|nr:OstA-like protein [Flavipsychrobacter sp.]